MEYPKIIYQAVVNKAMKKGRTCEEVDEGIRWLTEYRQAQLEEVEESLMREICYLDKLVDEFAKGKAIDKVMR